MDHPPVLGWVFLYIHENNSVRPRRVWLSRRQKRVFKAAVTRTLYQRWCITITEGGSRNHVALNNERKKVRIDFVPTWMEPQHDSWKHGRPLEGVVTTSILEYVTGMVDQVECQKVFKATVAQQISVTHAQQQPHFRYQGLKSFPPEQHDESWQWGVQGIGPNPGQRIGHTSLRYQRSKSFPPEQHDESWQLDGQGIDLDPGQPDRAYISLRSMTTGSESPQCHKQAERKQWEQYPKPQCPGPCPVVYTPSWVTAEYG